MAITTAIAIYFLIWWIVLFAVLPWGVRSQGDESVPGTDPGAPMVPRVWTKLLWTTIVAAVVWSAAAVAYVKGWVTLDSLSAWFQFPGQTR